MEKEVLLDTAIKIDGVETNKLIMRKPKVRDMIEHDKKNGSEAEKESWLVATLCQVSPKDLSELDWSDYKKLQDALKDFL